jgi:ABC-type multidrug transport system fused ATPase/permease subunit
MRHLFQLYQRKRVININLNVTAAGLLALALAKFPVAWVAELIGKEHKLLIALAAYFIDMVFDGFVYFALHWLANHWKPGEPEPVDRARVKRFFTDALIVQAERIALVPVFALIAIGGMYILQHQTDIKVSWIFVITYLTAILITRILHTVIGYRTGTFNDKRHAQLERIRRRKRARAQRPR